MSRQQRHERRLGQSLLARLGVEGVDPGVLGHALLESLRGDAPGLVIPVDRDWYFGVRFGSLAKDEEAELDVVYVTRRDGEREVVVGEMMFGPACEDGERPRSRSGYRSLAAPSEAAVFDRLDAALDAREAEARNAHPTEFTRGWLEHFVATFDIGEPFGLNGPHRVLLRDVPEVGYYAPLAQNAEGGWDIQNLTVEEVVGRLHARGAERERAEAARLAAQPASRWRHGLHRRRAAAAGAEAGGPQVGR